MRTKLSTAERRRARWVAKGQASAVWGGWSSISARLMAMVGASAATTFGVLRKYDVPVALALATARAQAARLGSNFPGGFDCVPFRRVRCAADLFRATGGELPF